MKLFKIHCLLAYSLFSLSLFAGSARSPLPGTFAGFVVMGKSTMKIPMQMNVIYYENEGESHATFLLRLSLGGFVSHEYQPYSFQIDAFNHASDVLVLDGTGVAGTSDVSIFDGKTSEDRREITGRLVSTRAGLNEGEFLIRYVDPKRTFEENNRNIFAIFPEKPLSPTITGSYESGCFGKESLQIEAARVSNFHSGVVTAFNGFHLIGRVSSNNPKAHPLIDSQLHQKDKNLVLATLSSRQGDLEFDLFGQTLILGALDPHMCRIDPQGLQCSQCYFRRSSDKNAVEFLDRLVKREFPCSRPTIPIPDEMLPGKPVSRASLSDEVEGDYLGHLDNEILRTARAISIRVNFSGSPTADGTIGKRFASLTVEKHFVHAYKDDSIMRVYPYLLRRARLGNSVKGQLFEGDSEILQISDWNTNEIRGVLYSKQFGRLGQFRVVRRNAEAEKFFDELTIKGCLEGKYVHIPKPGEGGVETQLHFKLVPERVGLNSLFPYNLMGKYLAKISYLGKTEDDMYSLLAQRDGSTYDPYTAVGMLRAGSTALLFGKFEDSEVVLNTVNHDLFADVSPHHYGKVYLKDINNPHFLRGRSRR